MKEIREAVRGVRCLNKTLLPYPQARGHQHIWVSTGAQGLAGTQEKALSSQLSDLEAH